MRYTILILFAITIGAFAGCEAQNPVCTENFCFVGEAFPRSELEDDQEFSEVAIDDSVIFATLIGTPTPVETQPVEVNPQNQNPTPPTQATLEGANQTTIGAIVSNTLSGGNRFEGTVVEITAVVDIADDENEYITLQTNNQDVTFFVNAYGDLLDGTLKTPFIEGDSYTLQLYIQEQELHDTLGNAVWSYPVEDIIDTQIDTIVSNTLAGGTRFEGKVVNISATVNYVSTTNRAMTLETNDTSISFWVDPFGDLEGEFQKTFVKGNSYNLRLYIQEQESNTVKSIRSYLVKVN